ncbi:hypothetical protein Bca4012_073257 [Brassica carinata]|uniref:Uncharacterized protein n=1 Tax=Brassica carinata TaxID=52824 RepID=A0A8X7QII3_BRACI|nr:hypothetical protein Bca52824_065579 [Brassica carinata]
MDLMIDLFAKPFSLKPRCLVRHVPEYDLIDLRSWLRVSGVMYMGYCVMRYCWWDAVIQIGGDGERGEDYAAEIGAAAVSCDEVENDVFMTRGGGGHRQ